MSTTSKLLKPPEDDKIYSDEILYGSRREAIRLMEFAKARTNPDCIVLTSKDTVVVKTNQWNTTNLIGLDKRLKTMAETLKVAHALPIQRFCWPQMHGSPFPFVCIAPKSSGKTFTHLFYILTQCISDVPMSKTNAIITGSEEQQGAWSDSAVQSNCQPLDVSHITGEVDFYALSKEEDAQSSSVGQQNLDQTNREAGLRNMGYTNIEPFEINADNFIEHPKYIVVCSSQNHVETIGRQIDRMKSAAFGSEIFHTKQNKLPPKVGIINVHQTDEKLAIRFNGCEVLITTPGALHKCIQLNLVDFTKCRRLFFDDIDLSLQLHNASIRDLVKLYVVQMQDHEEQQAANAEQLHSGQSSSQLAPLSACKIHMFSRKWTDLLKQSINTVFRQHVLIFGSIAEASIYGNLKYEMEYVNSDDLAISKLRALVERYESTKKSNDIMAITCKTNSEASRILSKLDNTDQNKAVVLATDSILNLKLIGRHKGPVYIISDSALGFTLAELNSVTHLVHFTIPEEHIIYDQRFRLMYRHLISSDSIELTTTVFVRPQIGHEFVKELYDVLSRSSTTLRSTKLELKDLISEKSTVICWRWASTGLCRLEKLSRDDRFGSFCLDRHSRLSVDLYPQNDRWPRGGQVKLTVTSLINPNEFYFWFEAHRNKDSPMKKWQKFESSGTEFMQSLQKKLDQLKDTQPNSVPLEGFNQKQVYGVYFHQEARVDRVVLLEKLNFDHVDPKKAPGTLGHDKIPDQFKRRYKVEYSNQVEVLKIDYGTKVNVYLRNIFALPESLATIEHQCYRGFHLGVKPTDNEPDWLYKAKKNFYELVCVDHLREVTAWMRLQSGRCFWFDNMVVSRELPEIGNKATFKTSPHEELIKKNLALKCTSEPSCLPPSDRLETLCKWEIDDAAKHARWAFLRKDKDVNDIFVLHVVGRARLELWCRLANYNKQLMEIEAKIRQDYVDGHLQNLSHFAEGVLCVVRLPVGQNPETKELFYEFNRCKIKQLKAAIEQDPDSVDAVATNDLNPLEYIVECLDHGDEFTVSRKQLYLARADYLRRLPFQAIRCTLADVNPAIFSDANLMENIKELLYDLTRSETSQMKVIKCRLKEQRDELYLYLPLDNGTNTYAPLIAILEQQEIPICCNDNPELRQFNEFQTTTTDDHDDDGDGDDTENIFESQSECVMRLLITEILDDIIKKQLGVEDEKEEEDDVVSELADMSIAANEIQG